MTPGSEGSVKHVVIVTHGIRTYGNWMDRLATALNAPSGSRVDVWKFRYGRFSLPSFLIPGWLRRRIVAKFNDAYEAAKRMHPAASVSVIAHSFGTYVVAEALQRYPSIKLQYVIFCGALVPKQYEWEKLFRAGRVERLVNECCLRDLMPVLARLFVVGMDSSGVFGFIDTPERADRFRNRKFAAYGHGGCFHEGHYRDFWVPIFNGEPIGDGPDPGSSAPWPFGILESVPLPVLRLVVVAAIVVVVIVPFRVARPCLPWPGPTVAELIAQGELAARPDDAERALKQAESKCPSAIGPKIALGRYYFRNTRYSEARSAFARAFDLSGRQDPVVARMLANAHIGERKYDAAAVALGDAEHLHVTRIGQAGWDELRRQLVFMKASLHLLVLLDKAAQKLWSAPDYGSTIDGMRLFIDRGGRPATWAHYATACARAVRLETDPLARADRAALREAIAVSLEEGFADLRDWSRKEPDKATPSHGLLLERLRGEKNLGGSPLLPEPCPAIGRTMAGYEPRFSALVARLQAVTARP